MEHKAFIFDYERFSHELFPILDRALISDECGSVIEFIRENHAWLKDPYEGETLPSDWETLLEIKDVHQYGDFALTKYYDPSEDLGLGASWQEIQQLVPGHHTFSPILGFTIGPNENLFDPGKMGSYFQTYDRVSQSLGNLQEFAQGIPSIDINQALEILERVLVSQKGLYVTF